jgi:hypothetical protein
VKGTNPLAREGHPVFGALFLYRVFTATLSDATGTQARSIYGFGWGGYYQPWWRHRYYGGYYGGWHGWGGRRWHGGDWHRGGWHGGGWHGHH